MKIIDANGQALNATIVRKAVKLLPERTIAKMHPTQLHCWQEVGMAVKDVLITKSDEPPVFLPVENRMAGHLIQLDMWFPEDRIRFECDGRELVGIINLWIPKPFADALRE